MQKFFPPFAYLHLHMFAGGNQIEYRKELKETKSQFAAFRKARHLSSHEAAHRLMGPGYKNYAMSPTVKTVNMWPSAAVKALRTNRYRKHAASLKKKTAEKKHADPVPDDVKEMKDDAADADESDCTDCMEQWFRRPAEDAEKTVVGFLEGKTSRDTLFR